MDSCSIERVGEYDISSPGKANTTSPEDMHSKPQRLEEECVVDSILTDEEEQLLNPEFWLELDPRIDYPGKRMDPPRTICPKEAAFVREALAVIRIGYLSVRKTSGPSTHLMDVLKDYVPRGILFNIGYCMSRMHDISSRLRSLMIIVTEDFPSVNFPSDGSTTSPDVEAQSDADADADIYVILKPYLGLDSSTKPQELDKSEKEASKIKIYYILLIMKEILAKMGIHPEVSEGNKRCVKHDLLDNQSAELMSLVGAGLRELKSVHVKRHARLTEMLGAVYKSFEPDTEEYKLGLNCEGLRTKWCGELSCDISFSISFLSGENFEMHRAFDQLTDLIDYRDMWAVRKSLVESELASLGVSFR